MKNLTQTNNWIYHCNIYQPAHFSLKMRTPIPLKRSKTGGGYLENQKYVIFLLLTIYLHNKHIYYGHKGKYTYAQTMAHLHGGAITFAQPHSDMNVGCVFSVLRITKLSFKRNTPHPINLFRGECAVSCQP